MKPNENPYESPETVSAKAALSQGFGITLLKSFVCMIIWPLLGIWLSHNFVERPLEYLLPFGGITTLLMLPVFVVVGGDIPEIFIVTMVLALWLLVLLLPVLGVHRSGWNPKGMLILQSSISFCQALLGTLFLFGKMA